MSMQNDGARSKAWCISRLDFFRSKPQFLEGPIPSERTTRIWWSHRQKYLTDVSGEISTCGEQGRCGGKVGICSEKNDSAGGGWDDCMDDSHRRDAEQGEAEGGAFADTSAADADHDAAPHHVAQVQAQSPSKESQSPVAARAADAARAAAAAVEAASDHASPAAATTAEGAQAPAAIAAATTGAVP